MKVLIDVMHLMKREDIVSEVKELFSSVQSIPVTNLFQSHKKPLGSCYLYQQYYEVNKYRGKDFHEEEKNVEEIHVTC